MPVRTTMPFSVSQWQQPTTTTTTTRRFKSTALEVAEAGRDLYHVADTVTGTDACQRVGLTTLGITNPTTIYRNLTYPELFQHEQDNHEGEIAHTVYGDTFAVDTGKYTGRSPKDRFIVYNEGSETATNIDWNDINQPTTPQVYKTLYDKAVEHFNTTSEAYVFDGYCGANPETRKNIRFVHEMAWQQHFVTYVCIYIYIYMDVLLSKGGGGLKENASRFFSLLSCRNLSVFRVCVCVFKQKHVYSTRSSFRIGQL